MAQVSDNGTVSFVVLYAAPLVSRATMKPSDSQNLLYVPILKWKMGEQTAVQHLASDLRARMLPIAELPDRPFDWEEDRATKSWDEHIVSICSATAKRWGDQFELAIDQVITDKDKTDDGAPAWIRLFETLWRSHIRAVPVLSSLASASEVDALSRLQANHGKRTRWVFRYEAEDPAYVDVGAMARWFEAAAATVRADPSQVDAVIDLGYIAGESKPDMGSVADAVSAVARLLPWRSVVLSCGAFPENLAGLSPGVHQLERRDWLLYSGIRQQPGYDRLVFSDYGVNHTDAFSLDPRVVKMSANLRYTAGDKWLVFKARSVKEFGFEQYRELCKILVNLPPFYGSAFSAADANYRAVAEGEAGPGNATNWRRDATHHHIAVVLSQLVD